MTDTPLCAYPGCGKPERTVFHCHDINCRADLSHAPCLGCHPFQPTPSLAERLEAVERRVAELTERIADIDDPLRPRKPAPKPRGGGGAGGIGGDMFGGEIHTKPVDKVTHPNSAPEPPDASEAIGHTFSCTHDCRYRWGLWCDCACHMHSPIRAAVPDASERTPEPKKPTRQHSHLCGHEPMWHDVKLGCLDRDGKESLWPNSYRDKPEEADAPEPTEPRRLTLHRYPYGSAEWYSGDDFRKAPEHMHVIELTPFVEAAIEKAKE